MQSTLPVTNLVHRRLLSRRTAAAGAAWVTPTIVLIAAAPFSAASSGARRIEATAPKTVEPPSEERAEEAVDDRSLVR